MTPSALVNHQTALGMTGVQLAKALGVTPVTLSYWRQGRRPIPAGLEARLTAITPLNGSPAPGRPKKATYALLCQDGTYAFYFDHAGRPLSNEDKMALPPGATFWLGRSPGIQYDGSPQQQYVRSTIPGHRQHSHPVGILREAPNRVV